jgi:hypothetical protein
LVVRVEWTLRECLMDEAEDREKSGFAGVGKLRVWRFGNSVEA